MTANGLDIARQLEELREQQRAILIGPRIFAAVDETVETAPAGDLDLHGFGRRIPAHEVRGLKALHGS